MNLIRLLIPGRRSLSLSVAVFYTATNAVFVHAGETAFWSTRRTAVRRMEKNGGNGKADPIVLAQLPGGVRLDFHGPMESSVVPAVSGERSLGGKIPVFKGDLPRWLVDVIAPYGTLGDVYLAKRPGAPIIIHIQDLHDSVEAQKNIAGLVESLQDARGISLVGLEGAQGEFATEAFRHLPDADITRGVAEHLMDQGYLGGPEFAGITAKRMPLLWGVEDLAAYNANVESVKASAVNRAEMETFLEKARQAMAVVKEVRLSPGLLEFDRYLTGYHSRKQPLGAYVRYLLHASPGSAKQVPNLVLLRDALRWEESLDFQKIEAERNELLTRLTRELSKDGLEQLVARSALYRLGRVSYGDYYRFVRSLCGQYGINLDSYPQLGTYVRYVLLAERINRNDLLTELERLERAVQDGLAGSDEERRIVRAARHLALLERLVRHGYTPADWGYHLLHQTEIREAGAEIAALARESGLPQSLSPPSLDTLRPFEEFCVQALGRNGALVKNLLDKLKSENRTAAVLVAGGFHTEGLAQLLRNRDVSYAIVTPKLNGPLPDGHRTLDLLARDPAPIEKLFAGETINIPTPRPLAVTNAKNPFVTKAVGLFAALTLALTTYLTSAPADAAVREGLAGLPVIENVSSVSRDANRASFTIDTPGVRYRGGSFVGRTPPFAPSYQATIDGKTVFLAPEPRQNPWERAVGLVGALAAGVGQRSDDESDSLPLESDFDLSEFRSDEDPWGSKEDGDSAILAAMSEADAVIGSGDFDKTSDVNISVGKVTIGNIINTDHFDLVANQGNSIFWEERAVLAAAVKKYGGEIYAGAGGDEFRIVMRGVAAKTNFENAVKDFNAYFVRRYSFFQIAHGDADNPQVRNDLTGKVRESIKGIDGVVPSFRLVRFGNGFSLAVRRDAKTVLTKRGLAESLGTDFKVRERKLERLGLSPFTVSVGAVPAVMARNVISTFDGYSEQSADSQQKAGAVWVQRFANDALGNQKSKGRNGVAYVDSQGALLKILKPGSLTGDHVTDVFSAINAENEVSQEAPAETTNVLTLDQFWTRAGRNGANQEFFYFTVAQYTASSTFLFLRWLRGVVDRTPQGLRRFLPESMLRAVGPWIQNRSFHSYQGSNYDDGNRAIAAVVSGVKQWVKNLFSSAKNVLMGRHVDNVVVAVPAGGLDSDQLKRILGKMTLQLDSELRSINRNETRTIEPHIMVFHLKPSDLQALPAANVPGALDLMNRAKELLETQGKEVSGFLGNGLSLEELVKQLQTAFDISAWEAEPTEDRTDKPGYLLLEFSANKAAVLQSLYRQSQTADSLRGEASLFARAPAELGSSLFRFFSNLLQKMGVAEHRARLWLGSRYVQAFLVPALEIIGLPGFAMLAGPFLGWTMGIFLGSVLFAAVHGIPGRGQSWAQYRVRVFASLAINFGALFFGVAGLGQIESLAASLNAFPDAAKIAYMGHSAWNFFAPEQYRLSMLSADSSKTPDRKKKKGLPAKTARLTPVDLLDHLDLIPARYQQLREKYKKIHKLSDEALDSRVWRISRFPFSRPVKNDRQGDDYFRMIIGMCTKTVDKGKRGVITEAPDYELLQLVLYERATRLVTAVEAVKPGGLGLGDEAMTEISWIPNLFAPLAAALPVDENEEKLFDMDISGILTDLVFFAANPKLYRETNEQMKSLFEDNNVAAAKENLESALRDLLPNGAQSHIRLKPNSSAMNKMLEKPTDYPNVESFYDLITTTIVMDKPVGQPDSLWEQGVGELLQRLVQKLKTFDPNAQLILDKKGKDGLPETNPEIKEAGYVHANLVFSGVKMEVQFKSTDIYVRQSGGDRLAAAGGRAHYVHKSEQIKHKLAPIFNFEPLSLTGHRIRYTGNFEEDFRALWEKARLYVYVTLEGKVGLAADIHKLPQGATVLDFLADVTVDRFEPGHLPNVSRRLSGNGAKPLSLDEPLATGDQLVLAEGDWRVTSFNLQASRNRAVTFRLRALLMSEDDRKRHLSDGMKFLSTNFSMETVITQVTRFFLGWTSQWDLNFSRKEPNDVWNHFRQKYQLKPNEVAALVGEELAALRSGGVVGRRILPRLVRAYAIKGQVMFQKAQMPIEMVQVQQAIAAALDETARPGLRPVDPDVVKICRDLSSFLDDVPGWKEIPLDTRAYAIGVGLQRLSRKNVRARMSQVSVSSGELIIRIPDSPGIVLRLLKVLKSNLWVQRKIKSIRVDVNDSMGNVKLEFSGEVDSRAIERELNGLGEDSEATPGYTEGRSFTGTFMIPSEADLFAVLTPLTEACQAWGINILSLEAHKSHPSDDGIGEMRLAIPDGMDEESLEAAKEAIVEAIQAKENQSSWTHLFTFGALFIAVSLLIDLMLPGVVDAVELVGGVAPSFAAGFQTTAVFSSPFAVGIQEAVFTPLFLFGMIGRQSLDSQDDPTRRRMGPPVSKKTLDQLTKELVAGLNLAENKDLAYQLGRDWVRAVLAGKITRSQFADIREKYLVVLGRLTAEDAIASRWKTQTVRRIFFLLEAFYALSSLADEMKGNTPIAVSETPRSVSRQMDDEINSIHRVRNALVDVFNQSLTSGQPLPGLSPQEQVHWMLIQLIKASSDDWRRVDKKDLLERLFDQAQVRVEEKPVERRKNFLRIAWENVGNAAVSSLAPKPNPVVESVIKSVLRALAPSLQLSRMTVLPDVSGRTSDSAQDRGVILLKDGSIFIDKKAFTRWVDENLAEPLVAVALARQAAERKGVPVEVLDLWGLHPSNVRALAKAGVPKEEILRLVSLRSHWALSARSHSTITATDAKNPMAVDAEILVDTLLPSQITPLEYQITMRGIQEPRGRTDPKITPVQRLVKDRGTAMEMPPALVPIVDRIIANPMVGSVDLTDLTSGAFNENRAQVLNALTDVVLSRMGADVPRTERNSEIEVVHALVGLLHGLGGALTLPVFNQELLESETDRTPYEALDLRLLLDWSLGVLQLTPQQELPKVAKGLDDRGAAAYNRWRKAAGNVVGLAGATDQLRASLTTEGDTIIHLTPALLEESGPMSPGESTQLDLIVKLNGLLASRAGNIHDKRRIVFALSPGIRSLAVLEIVSALERRSGQNLPHLKGWANQSRLLVQNLTYEKGSNDSVLDGAGFLDTLESVNPFFWALEIKGVRWAFGRWASRLVGFLLAVLSGKGFKDVNEKASTDQQRIRHLRYQA